MKEQFSPLLQWMESASFQIQISALAPEVHVRALVKHLGRDALKAFMLARRRCVSWATERCKRHRTRLLVLCLSTASCLPNTHWIYMRVTVKSLQNDVQRYALYMTNGDIAVYNT